MNDKVRHMTAHALVIAKRRRNPPSIVKTNDKTKSQSIRFIVDFPVMVVEMVTNIRGPAVNHSPHTTAGVATLEKEEGVLLRYIKNIFAVKHTRSGPRIILPSR